MGSTSNSTRLNVRLASEHKRLIEEAAGLLGQSVSAFTVSTLVREAEEVVEQSGTIRLSHRDAKAFLASLDNPPPPNEKLKEAFEAHEREVVS